MRLRSELLLYTAVLAAVNLLFAFGAIGLFMRMGPAIERILEENVASIDAAEAILLDFAAYPGAVPAEHHPRIREAVARAASNVTEAAERPVTARIQQRLEPALGGDPAARTLLIEDLRQLIAINREAMVRVDAEARRYGTGGAWAAVAVGAASFLLSLLVTVQLRRRVIEPLNELHGVLGAARAGDRFRRCRGFDAAIELRQAGEAVNALLDERTRR